MRFHLDEHVDHAIAQALRLRGIDVTTSVEANLLGATDEQQIEFARGAGRVIYTQDSDFVKLHRAGVVHAGIVYGPSGVRTIGEVVRFLCLLHDCVEPAEMLNAVEFL